ncbi:MAG: hypothetical protein ACYDDF_03380 [Thermoplasmatota archaeon]
MRAKLPDMSPGYGRESAAKLFLALCGKTLPAEDYLAFCRDYDLSMERVERLLALRRLADAASAARDVPHYRFLEAMDLLVRAGRNDLAVAEVRARLGALDHPRFRDEFKRWLQLQAERGNKIAEARGLAWGRFRERPTVETYTSLRQICKRARSWATDESEALRQLEELPDEALLTEVHLQEGRIDEALHALGNLRAGSRGGLCDELTLRVARAARNDHPQEAGELFLAVADSLIARRTRSYYAQAAPLVKESMACRARGRGPAGAAEFRSELRGRYGGFPALWDELRIAGLTLGP